MLFVFFKIWKIKLPVVLAFLLGIYIWYWHIWASMFLLDMFQYFWDVWFCVDIQNQDSRCLVVLLMGKIIPGVFSL